MTMQKHGQVLSEFLIAMLLLVLPAIIGGILWSRSQWRRAECSYQAFSSARQQIVHSDRSINQSFACNDISQVVQLSRLEDLDQNKNAIELQDLISEAEEDLHLLERQLRSLQSPQPSGSRI